MSPLIWAAEKFIREVAIIPEVKSKTIKRMKPIHKLYLKTFLIMGIPFGLIMMALDLADGSGFSLWKLLFLTFFFGIFMSLVMVSSQVSWLKKAGKDDFTEEDLAVSHTKALKSKLNIKEVFEKLKKDSLFCEMKMTETDSGIRIYSGVTSRSWGEKIKIILNSSIGDEFECQVSSKPKFLATLFDNGINLENINRIENVLKA